jgi:hypothetical protein
MQIDLAFAAASAHWRFLLADASCLSLNSIASILIAGTLDEPDNGPHC